MVRGTDINKKHFSRKDSKRSEVQEVYELKAALSKLNSEIVDVGSAEAQPFKSFSDLPISLRTKEGLDAAHFVEMTEIQRLTIPAALSGKDILGSAETGSGKSLAFLVPVLEKLYLEGWSSQDGLGALILAPTRELAIQIFQVLRRIGSKHYFSAGLVIGGQSLQTERDAIARMTILVATPGRLLQHMDQAVGFEWGGLQILVLDEADRILDLGFAKTVDAIIHALPTSRQTLLFSATQSASVKSLARLSLKNPIPLATSSLRVASEDSDASKLKTPNNLSQFFLFSSLPNKLDHLWSFVRQHVNDKIIVFVSSCKQVRFIYESFCRLQPGIPIAHLHGRQKQFRRMNVFADFCRKKTALLIATDVAARGLDFPAVDWVVQVDCPEDVETYVHRVGRTARYESKGSSLLFLLKSESFMLKLLRDDISLPIQSYQNRSEDKEAQPRLSIKSKLQALCSQSPELKYLAQKSLTSYVRSIFLSKNKNVFSIDGIPFEDFAMSIGLPGVPKLRFIERQSAAKNSCRDLSKCLEHQDDDEESMDEKASASDEGLARKVDKNPIKEKLGISSKHQSKPRKTLFDQSDDSSDDESELLTVKRREHEIRAEEFDIVPPSATSHRDLLKTKKKYRIKHSDERAISLVFDEETGEAYERLPFQPETEFDKTQVPSLSSKYVEEGRHALASADVTDKERIKQLKREKNREKKKKSREQMESSSKKVRLDVPNDDSDY